MTRALKKFGDRGSSPRFPGLRSILATLWGYVVIGALVIGATIGLTSLASHPSKPAADSGYVGPPGSGITVRTELAEIWIPRTLYRLASRQSENPMRRCRVKNCDYI